MTISESLPVMRLTRSASSVMETLVPKGRDEDGLPWPMAWLKRHDVYED